MKNIKKILLLLLVFVSLFSFSSLNASTGTYSQNMSVSRHGSSASQVINTPPFGTEKQTYSVNVSGRYDGHGGFGPSGGKYGISVCISNTGSMWNGSCWNVVDPNGAGNIGDASGNIPSTTVDIGNTSNDFHYVGAEVYVNDADANVTLTMYGREVSINGFNTTNTTVSVGGQFDITWDATERTGNSVLTFSGPVSCGTPSPYSTANNFGGLTCTGSSAGTATFNLQATGYGGYGEKTVNAQPITVNVVAPPVSCGNGSVEAGEQCDTGVNNGSCPRSCSNACTVNSCSGSVCGNNIREGSEACDQGGSNGPYPAYCSNLCNINSAPGGNVNINFTVTGPGTVGSNFTGANRYGPAVYDVNLAYNTYVDFDVIPNPGESSGWIWTGLCSFFNSPLNSHCFGNATANIVTGVTFIPIPVTGTLTPANSTCTIPAGQSGCYSPTLTWSTSGFRNGIVATVTSSTGVPASVTGNSGSSAFYVPHNPGDPANEFYLSHNGTTLATAVVTTSCAAGTIWSGGVCTVVTTPTINSVIINSNTINPDGNTQYTITVRGTDTGGGDKISHEYALVNYLGNYSGSYRGYLTWYYDQTYTGWNALKDKMNCSGGGIAAVQSGYGSEYVELDSCVTSVSGQIRTTTFTVKFNPVFGSNGPLTLNDIAGYIHNKDGNFNDWTNFDINFALYMPPPTNLVVTCPAPGTTLNATWTSPGAGYNTFYYRAENTPLGSWSANVDSSTVTGTSKSIASVAGITYNVWVHTRDVTNPNFYSSLIVDTVTCGAPAAPTVSLTASPNPVASGNSTTLTWTVSGATSCSNVGANAIPAGNWSTAGSGNVSSGAIASARTYQLSCTGAGGTTLSSPVTVNVTSAPVVTLTASPNPVASGNSTTLTWTVSGATSCSNVGANAIPAGNWSTAGSGNVSSGAIASARTYRLSCTGPGGTTLSPSITVNISATPTLTVTSPTTVAPGASVNLSFDNINISPSPTPQDWIGLYSTSAAYPSTEMAYIYTSNCSAPASGLARSTGTCTNVFSMPATPGTYHFRLYSQDLYDQLQAVSNTVTVSAPSTFTLSVAANSSLGGRVTSPGIIDCGSDCSENVSSGSNVTLTAIPSSSYWRFNGWSGVCSGNNTVCTINNITAPVSATALFVPRAFIYREF